MAKVVILGGGIGGLSTAHHLQKKIDRQDQVIVIDRQKSQYFNPSLLWLLTGERTPAALYRDLSCLPEHGIGFIHDEAVEVRPGRKEIILKQSPSVVYDVLLLATGADYDFGQYADLSAAGYSLYTIEGVTGLRQALTEFQGGQIAIVIPRLPIKCPGTVYEAAFLLRNHLAKRGLQSETVIDIYTPESYPLLDLGPAVSEFTLGQIVKQKINVHYEMQFQKVWASEKDFRRRLQFKSGEVKCDLLIYVPPHRGSGVILNSGLGDGRGWVSADPLYLTTAYPDIFAMGDAADIRLPNGKSMTKCGAVGTFQSYVASKNVLAALKGKKPGQSYGGWTMYVMEIGKGKAVTAIGKLYSEGKPRFWITPKSRIWRLNKRLVEYMWKNRVKLTV